MMTTLFSVSFTSCIDTEVSPMVEAIYEAQADLIAAQTGVQKAEAALLTAQASAAQAQADWNAAQAAQVEAITAGIVDDNAFQALKREQEILVIMAEANLAVAEAQNALAEENLNWEIAMAELMAELDAANVELIEDYANEYMLAMNAANVIQSDLLEAEGNLADAELMLTGAVGSEVSFAYNLAMLENAVAVAQASVDDTQAKLDMFNDYAEDPIAAKELLDAQRTDLRAQYEALQQDRADQLEVINLINFDESERDTYTGQLTGVAGTPLFDHNADVTTKNNNLASIETAQDLIDDYQEAIDDYAGVEATLTQAVTDAQTAVDTAEAALGMEDADGDTPAVGAYYPVDADGDLIAIGGAKYAAPANLQEVYVNARIDLLDATDAFNTYESDIAALVASYNAAAVALANAQAAFDGNTYAADLTAAQTDVDNAQTAFDAAMLAYTDAKTAFEAAPTGSDVEDGAMLAVTDLGEVGIQDGPTGLTTYMRVATWTETSVGSGNYIPATFEPTKYSTASLATELAALYALDGTPYAGGEVGAEYAVSGDTEVVLWNQDGTSTDGAGNPIPLPFNTTYLTGGEAQDALSVVGNIDIEIAYFVEVESDDVVVTNLYAFNEATNMLGNNDFSDRAFDIDAPTYASPNYILITDANASYDVSPNANGQDDTAGSEGTDEFTAYAALWNAQLDLAIAQDAFDTGDDALVAAQEAFDYQKELFDEGVANLAALEATMDAADTAEEDAMEAVDEAWVALGQSFAEGEATDTPREEGDAVPTDSLTLSEQLYNAEIALALHLDTTVEDYEGMIATQEANIAAWEAENAQLQILIDANYAVVAELLGELDDLGVEYTFEVDEDGLGQFEVTNDLSGDYTDLSAELIAANKVLWDINQEIAIVSDKQTMVNALISAWNSSYNTFVNTTIPNLEASLVTAQTDLAEAEAALALAENEETAATANLAYLQALIDTLEQRHANALAVAAEYKALMDAAIAAS